MTAIDVAPCHESMS